MNTNRILVAMLAVVLAIASCTRDNDVLEEPATPVAGETGKAVLNITPRHHLKNIDTCVVYIKYNSLVLPSNMKFDDSTTVFSKNGVPVASFDSLNRGDYYIYAKGWDPKTDIDQAGHVVMGGGPVTIYDSAKTYDIFIDVNEDADHIH